MEKNKPQAAKFFMKYLLKAADKVVREKKPAIKAQSHDDNSIQLRYLELSEARKMELDQKVYSYFDKNRFVPYEIKLRKIKDSLSKIPKTTSKTKLRNLQKKVQDCEDLLFKLRQSDIPGH